MIVPFGPGIKDLAYDVCIAGAGPVGIALALGCEQQGLSVLLLESGEEKPDSFAASLGAGHAADPARHAAATVAMYRGLGGTSRWWGGRCVPFDDIDFADRPHVAAKWPFAHDEARAWYGAAADFFRIGPAVFEAPLPAWAGMQGAAFAELERWTPQINAARVHEDHLAHSSKITVVTGATVTGLVPDPENSRVAELKVAGQNETIALHPACTVLACGGLETTRLLLAAQRHAPAAFGGQGGPLGRYYMGHMSGKIADLVVEKPAAAREHDFFLSSGAFARRRFSIPAGVQMDQKLLNTSFWADNPPFHDARHSNGVLSLVWFALAIPAIGRKLVSEGVRLSHTGPKPYQWGRHLWNIAGHPLSTLASMGAILKARFLSKPRKPGFLLFSRSGRYALHFHSEQSPLPESRVSLLPECDAHGLPFLKIGLQFSEQDAAAVVRAHAVLDSALRDSGLGRLEFHQETEAARIARVMELAADGFHQAGTTRMGDDPATNVTNRDCRVHGFENLFIASSSVFPTSGQANPTFLAVALAFRLAAHLGSNTSPLTARKTAA